MGTFPANSVVQNGQVLIMHDISICAQVLGPLGHPKMMPTYMPIVEAAFPEKNRLRVQVQFRTVWQSLPFTCSLFKA